jgi:hypothetical protein
VARSGRVIARFDHRTQHSGNISWLVETRSGAFFVRQLEFPMLRLLARTPMTETRGRRPFQRSPRLGHQPAVSDRLDTE